MTAAAKHPVFPLIRHLSRRVTPVLARLPVSANQITLAGLVTGLAAAWGLMQGTHAGALMAGGLFLVSYVLDNCDGEIARLKGQTTTFGKWFDTFVDWVVNAAFFIALGIGFSSAVGNDIWYWMGLAAAGGGTLNFLIAVIASLRAGKASADGDGEKASRDPIGVKEWVVFAFRDLMRADFCFIVLALAVFDLTWVLLPAGAVGAQLYWIAQFVQGARDFRA